MGANKLLAARGMSWTKDIFERPQKFRVVLLPVIYPEPKLWNGAWAEFQTTFSFFSEDGQKKITDNIHGGKKRLPNEVKND